MIEGRDALNVLFLSFLCCLEIRRGKFLPLVDLHGTLSMVVLSLHFEMQEIVLL